MEADELTCNYKKCRKRLTTVGYVTACSHVFCDEDGTREFNKSNKCPACQTELSAKFEIVRNNLQPTEQYKSMVLAGLRPDIICEISSRALSFWMYQSQQEKIYQEYRTNKSKERANQLEQYYEQILSRTNAELSTLSLQLSGAKQDIEEAKKKLNEVTEKFMERNRQYSKLQSLYDSMRRKYINMSSFDSDTPSAGASGPSRAVHSAGDADEMHAYFSRERGIHSRSVSPKSFELKPNNICMAPPANHVRQKYSIDLGTPRS